VKQEIARRPRRHQHVSAPDALHVAVMARTDHVDDTGSGRRKKSPEP
jgi:hypothetical protein